MTIKVEFYSSLRDVAGVEECECEVPEGSTVADLWKSLCRTHPELKSWESKVLFAANLDYVERSHVLCPGEILSIMPPVQGG